MTLYGLLLTAGGLSYKEAAELHGVSVDAVKSWASGRRKPQPERLYELRVAYSCVTLLASDTIQRFKNAPAVILSAPGDDDDARAQGVPCIGAWRAAAAIVVATLPTMPVIFNEG